MKLKQMIVDADICIKLGSSSKYRYVEKLFPAIAEKINIHKTVYDEIMMLVSAKEQVDALIQDGILELIDEYQLGSIERKIYDDLITILR